MIRPVVRSIIRPVVRSLQGIEQFPSTLLDGNTPAWWDYNIIGAKGVTKDASDFVSAWKDQLGSGVDLLQAVGADQPKWFSADGILFDSISDFMKTAPFTFIQPEMIYIVLKQVTWITNTYIIDGNTDSLGRIQMKMPSPGIQAYAGTVSGISSDFIVNSFSIIRLLFNGASSKLIVDNHTPIIGDFGANNMGGFTLGKPGTFSGLFSNIQAKEIILRKVVDPDQKEASIFNYLRNKYRTP